MSTGRGNAGTPGIYSDQQIEGWREVVNAVHEKVVHGSSPPRAILNLKFKNLEAGLIKMCRKFRQKVTER
jgi:hypothetical protein